MLRSISTTKTPTHRALPVFSVVAVHDGFSAGGNVRETLEKAERLLGADLHVRSTSWNFQKLAQPPWRSMSARLVAEAHLVIVTIPGTMPLPDHLVQWLGSCLQQEKHGRPVLAVFHDADTIPGPAFDQLTGLASLWKAEFLSRQDFDRRFDLEFAQRIIRQKSAATSSSRQPLIDLDPGMHFGGINE